MKKYIVHLIPCSSHEIALHSDTLFGAICWGIRMLFGENKLMKVLDEFNGSPPFLISSAFPCKIDGNGYTYFFPKPILKPLTTSDLDNFSHKIKSKKQTYHSDKFDVLEIAARYKKFKKIKFFRVSNFKKILKRPEEAELFADYLDGLLMETNHCISEITQKNSLDRLTNSTSGSGNTFHVPEIAYRKNFGLYFFLTCHDINEYLKPVLHFVEDSGIGPNARTGKNWFKTEITEKSLSEEMNSQSGDSFITLSRYIKNEPINANNSFYQIASVRSKVESRLEFSGEDIWKHRVSYFTAGSVIKPKNKSSHYGRLAPVKVLHDKTIYQYGYAYPVWINSGVTNEI